MAPPVLGNSRPPPAAINPAQVFTINQMPYATHADSQFELMKTFLIKIFCKFRKVARFTHGTHRFETNQT